ncbi:CatA-like O-acetyltransferase [Aureivirga sp. CE67]|uniref:CatA-like O-acetyltransferase n=1 Tax=Aureivirga sp. CE67 TaxID=1788983 RepID=UPI0018CB52E1|nr:CatA-like O-acetyltransferase [Aureivirga sp. CE67]
MKSNRELEFIEKYNGRILEENEISSYEKWALHFFHDKESVQEPYLQMTLQIDITEALKNYKENYKSISEASFTAYLMWNIVQAGKKHPFFRYRKIQGKWYIFEELPLYAPIAVGGDARFSDLSLEPFVHTKVEDFFLTYRSTQDKLFSQAKFSTVSDVYWENAWFIGNLPHLQFTGFQIHSSSIKNGKPFFYFGKRYKQDSKEMIPLLIAFDHSNLDPLLLSAYMEDFQNLIEGKKL